MKAAWWRGTANAAAELKLLSERYGCPSVEFGERLPVPPALLAELDGAALARQAWFPLLREGETVVVAAADPRDPALKDTVRRACNAETVEVWVALREEGLGFVAPAAALLRSRGPGTSAALPGGMIAGGLAWYLPVRKEQSEAPRA